MSLQLWMPLTKDLRQQGVSGITPTQTTGYTSVAAGKLGGCYKFTGTFDTLLPLSNWNWTEGSVSFGCWAKISQSELATLVNAANYDATYNSMGGTLLGRDSYGGLGLRWKTNNIYSSSTLSAVYIYVHMRNTSSSSNNTSQYTIPFDTWFHVMAVIDRNENKIKVYINGELFTSTNLTVTGTFSTGTFRIAEATWDGGNGRTSAGCWQLNDIRVYNHALSQMEVKELAKGLVLHYPLNANSTYTSLIDANAGYNVYNNFGSDVTTSLTATGETFMGAPVRRLTMTIKNSSRVNSFKTELWSHGVYNWSRTFLANTKYCFWIYYKPVTHTDIRAGGTASNISGWTEIAPEYVGDGWYRVGQYRNGSVTTDKTDNIFVSFTWASAAVDTPISIDFAYPTLVQGLTEIQPNINYGNSSIMYDCSGFCNNADVTGTWNIANDTPKYQHCMHMSTTNSKIHISNFPTSGFGNSYSFVWWGKRSSNGPMFWGFSDGVRLNGMYAGTLWNTGDSSSNPIYVPGTTTTITAPSVNVWHHYVMTGDGTTCKLYVDGVLYGQAKTYKAISGTSIYINGWDSSTSYCSDNTDISDFRIYATALSASDVLSLYQNNAYIDSNNIIHGKIRA